MHDRETVDDTEALHRYLAAVPQPDSAYRTRLRARLAAAPAPSRPHPPRLRRWEALGALVGAIALALVLALFAFHPEAPLSPKTVLARAIRVMDHPVPYHGSSELSFYQGLQAHRIVSTWAVRDMTHWRVNFRIVQPISDRRREVAVANGRSVVWSGGIDGRVVHVTLSHPELGAALLGMFEAGDQGLAIGQTLKQYLAALNNPQSRTHARLIGQQAVLGRKADVIEVWPIIWSGNSSCTTSQRCVSTETGYGRERLWIDHQRGIPLRVQQSGIPASLTEAPHNLLYRVTSLSFGQVIRFGGVTRSTG